MINDQNQGIGILYTNDATKRNNIFGFCFPRSGNIVISIDCIFENGFIKWDILNMKT